MPAGYSYTVVEDKYSNYTVSMSSDSSNTQIDNTNRKASESSVASNVTLTYNNTSSESYGLTIKKEVQNKDIAKDGAPTKFKFTINLTGVENGFENTNLVMPDTYVSRTADQLVIELEDGESFTITGLPKGYGYTVVEDDYTEYYSPSITAGSNANIYNSARKVTNSKITKSSEVVKYVNKAIPTNIVVPTGIRMDIVPYVILLIAAIGGSIVLWTIHRRKKR